MRTSNAIIFGVLIALSVALLALYFYLGFHKVGGIGYILLSVVWWGLIAGLIFGISRVEANRRRQLRTFYVSPTAIYNPECGVIACNNPNERADRIYQMLATMRYGFTKHDLPQNQPFDCRYVVRTDEFKQGDVPVWNGSVVRVDPARGNREKAFSTRQTLASMLL